MLIPLATEVADHYQPISNAIAPHAFVWYESIVQFYGLEIPTIPECIEGLELFFQ